MKPLVLFFMLVGLLIRPSVAQEIYREPGEVIFQLVPGQHINQFLSEIQTLNLAHFKVDTLSSQMGIYRVSGSVPEGQLLSRLRSFSSVNTAQYNHVVSDRATLPNDPFISNQWHHSEVNDHDIDSDLAWDITTGGKMMDGTDIVVCVIEGDGCSWATSDLVENHWVNNYEIPGNGIDDDENGYVDDYHGWNTVSLSDQIPGGSHGTQVSSMIGARGNNDLGISGVNWDVKLMQVVVGPLNEANIIRAYDYPLTMRKLYNSSQGTAGALIVATNASFGVDNVFGYEAPLWCAMYDSLGHHGVISIGATANNPVNVDLVGDLPTTCTSEYLIGVTATDNLDIRRNGAYGPVSIDLAAPGVNVYLANNSGGYGAVTGTSFSAPCVSGAVALLYALPCLEFSELVQLDPARAARLVKKAVLDGVDAVDNLQAETFTGGRLNVNNSLQILAALCTDCPQPFDLEAKQEFETDYLLSWQSLSLPDSYSLRYRSDLNPEWAQENGLTTNHYLLENLTRCATYEVQIQSQCNDTLGRWSEPLFWTSDGCCVSPESHDLTIEEVTSESLGISWPSILAAEEYVIYISDEGASFSDTLYTSDTRYDFTDLSACTNYLLSVRSICQGENAAIPEAKTVKTHGCEGCSETAVCEISANASNEWIAGVVLQDLNNMTASDKGYGDYTSLGGATLTQGESYEIALSPGYRSSKFPEYFRVWIDYNGNGTFESNEEAFDAGGQTTEMIQGNITVPMDDLIEGAVRMRVIMYYKSAIGGIDFTGTCGYVDYGEIEDYCVYLTKPAGIKTNMVETAGFILYPNPANNLVCLEYQLPNLTPLASVDIFDATGRLVYSEGITSKKNYIDVSAWPHGMYLVKTQDQDKLFQARLIIQ